MFCVNLIEMCFFPRHSEIYVMQWNKCSESAYHFVGCCFKKASVVTEQQILNLIFSALFQSRFNEFGYISFVKNSFYKAIVYIWCKFI